MLVTGLSAAGLAGFLTVSAFIDHGDAGIDPQASSAPPAGAPAGSTGGQRSSEDAEAGVLRENALYSNGELTEVTCETPELDPDDEESMEQFLHTVTDCLDTAWGDHFESSGMAFEKPQRIYWHNSGQSPCGSYPAPGSAAFYCGANNGLYLGLDHITNKSGDTEHPEAYTFLLSHEYGHHVQEESGILGYVHASQGDQEHNQDVDALTRRSELQANCLGGNFLGAADDSLSIGSETRANILDDAERRGDLGADERTHGSPENGSMWTAHGMDRSNPAACNTWAARDSLVN